MVNKCNAAGCFTNHPGYNTGTVFKIPKNEELRLIWIKFLNRTDIDSLLHIFLCEKHFEEKYLKKNDNRTRLIMNLNPIPTLFSNNQQCLPVSVLPTISKIRKSPTERVFQEDELAKFKENDAIHNFNQVNETFLNELPSDFSYKKMLNTFSSIN